MKHFETQSEKRAYLLQELLANTSEEFLSKLFLENLLEIVPSRPYKDSIGCPIIYLGLSKEPKSIRDIACGRRVFREINGTFPLRDVINILRHLDNNQEPTVEL